MVPDESPVSVHNPSQSPGPSPQTPQQNPQQMEQAYQTMRRKMRIQQMIDKIDNKIMVLSGKGGVGKSTVAVGLALSLAQKGAKVGILDIDITGPNVPKMLGLGGKQLSIDDGMIVPISSHRGLKVISMAFLLEDDDKPVVWRGPIKLGAIQQFIGDVAWGELDYMIIDFPPGTSDEPLTVAQTITDIDGMVIVSTPQEVALMDSRKAAGFATTLKIPILGVVENMSGYSLGGTVFDTDGTPLSGTQVRIDAPAGVTLDVTSDEAGRWSAILDIFKSGGAEEAATQLGVPFLGRLPFDPGVVRGGDDGVHRVLADPEGATALAFSSVVENILTQLELSTPSGGPSIL